MQGEGKGGRALGREKEGLQRERARHPPRTRPYPDLVQKCGLTCT